jgi:hypothetical protein
MLTYVQTTNLAVGDIVWHQGNAWVVSALHDEAPMIPGGIPGLTHVLRRVDQSTLFRYTFNQVKTTFCLTQEESMQHVNQDTA